MNVGYNFARGNNNVSNSTVAANVRYRTEQYQVTLDAQSLFNSRRTRLRRSRYFGNLRYDRYLSPQSFWFTRGSLEHDESRAWICARTSAAASAGSCCSQAKHEANLLGGVTYVNEQYQDPTPTAPNGSSSEALMGMDHAERDPRRHEATNKSRSRPNLVQLGRYRMAMETGVALPLLTRYIWSFQFFDRFDSRPPVEAKRNDYGAISSFGVTF